MPKPEKTSSLTSLGVLAVMLLTWPLAHLPFSWGLAIGSAGGRLAFLILRRRREIAVANIQRAMDAGVMAPNLDPVKIARRAFAGLGQTAIESLYILHRGIDFFNGHYAFQGANYFIEAVAQARQNKTGLVMLTGHLGNWELSCHAISKDFNLKMSIVGRSQGGPIIDTLLIRLRAQGGNSFIFKDGGAPDMLRTLRASGVIGTLFDQAAIVGGEGTPLNFMGRPALTNLGPVKLAARTGSQLIPVFSRRVDGQHTFHFLPAMNVPTGNRQIAVTETTQKLNDLLADFIVQYPEQWMWGHRRWKTPEDIEKDAKSY